MHLYPYLDLSFLSPSLIQGEKTCLKIGTCWQFLPFFKYALWVSMTSPTRILPIEACLLHVSFALMEVLTLLSSFRKLLETHTSSHVLCLAWLSKFFVFLRFSSPRAVKTPPGAQKGAPNPKLGSPDAGRNLAKNAKNQKTSFLRPSKARPWMGFWTVA